MNAAPIRFGLRQWPGSTLALGLALGLALLAVLLAAPAARAFETRAGSAWVYDLTTGTVLLEKNADQPLPPASMSKLMTLNMLFEALAEGRVTLDTKFGVSTRAKNMGGSTMFLNETDRPTVEELIKGIIVMSGNDACVVVAEGLAGTEEAFAAQMTERGRVLGLTGSTFTNASGWPDPRHRMTMRDLGLLARRLITEFPQYYGYFGLIEFAYDGRSPDNRFNRNPLLKLGIGADGLKTGHTTEAGYGLAGSAVQGGRRVIFVLSGLSSERERTEESERIVNWSMRQFVLKTLAKGGQRLGEAEVHMGKARQVGLVLERDLTVLLPALAGGEARAEIVYTGPLTAPIGEGQEIAVLVVEAPGMAPHRAPLLAETAVPRGGFITRIRTAARLLSDRFLGEAGT